MSVDEKMLNEQLPARSPVTFAPPKRQRRRPRRRLRKLRIFSIALAFATLALISAVFGMLMSVAADLPALKLTAQSNPRLDSYLYDDTGAPIGVLAAPGHPGDDTWGQISPAMRKAIVAVEDRRFWSDPGVDLKGLVRAAVADVSGAARQGGSTIAEQFVKLKLREENSRTIFEKLREAALAFQLVQRWGQKTLLTDYLNSVYFGNGAIGIESAARIYFGDALGYDPNDPAESRCGDPTVQDPALLKCAARLQPYQAALLAGMVASPTAFDPLLDARAAKDRRDLVLRDMVQQHDITRAYYDEYKNYPVPTTSDIQPPSEPAAAPYFTAWVRPQIIHALEHDGIRSQALAEYEAYHGGLKIRLTLDLALQQAAQQTIDNAFPGLPNPPTATLVAIDNKTGEVRAMVSGNGDFKQSQFNLATEGRRQPGSAFKVFTLAAALSTGQFGPYSVFDSHPLDIPYRDSIGKTEDFKVRNFGNFYSGPMSLAAATAVSDNTVFVQLGLSKGVGTGRIRRFARSMGIRTPISRNPAMILGGLATGVSALDMAHAYETVATGGVKVYNRILGDGGQGPIGIRSISACSSCAVHNIVNTPDRKRVMSPEVAATIKELLAGVLGPGGTGAQAAIPGVEVVGKTGTTSNYADAWFVGWTPELTTAVWVGYPNGDVPMRTQWQGQPVEGGTYPAVIWRTFMTSALQTLAQEAANSGTATTQTSTISTGAPSGATQSTTSTVSTNTTATTLGTATTGATSTTGAAGAGPGGTSSTAAGGAGTTGAGGQGAGATGGGAGAAGGATGAGGGTTGAGGAGAAGGAAGGATGAAGGATGAAGGATGAAGGGAGAAGGATGATGGPTGAAGGATGAAGGATGPAGGATGTAGGGTAGTGSSPTNPAAPSGTGTPSGSTGTTGGAGLGG